MVVVDIIREKPLQMPFVQHDHMIEQLSSAAFDPSIRNSILPWASERGLLRLAAHGLHRSHNLKPEFLIPVEDQILVRWLERERLPQLLHDPTAGWVARDIAMQDPPAVVRKNEPAIEHSQRDRMNREEIHGRERFTMISQKGLPSIPPLGISRRPLDPPGNSAFRNIKAKHLQLSVNSGSAPRRVLSHHAEYQLA